MYCSLMASERVSCTLWVMGPNQNKWPWKVEIKLFKLKISVIINIKPSKKKWLSNCWNITPCLAKVLWRCNHHRHVPKSKNLGGHVVMRRAAACRRLLLICQNLGGHVPPLPPPLAHACYDNPDSTLMGGTQGNDLLRSRRHIFPRFVCCRVSG